MKQSETTETDLDFILELLRDEHPDWMKAKRSGDGSRQMLEARKRMNALLDTYLEEKKEMKEAL